MANSARSTSASRADVSSQQGRGTARPSYIGAAVPHRECDGLDGSIELTFSSKEGDTQSAEANKIAEDEGRGFSRAMS
jgi:hypothetical protein